MAHTRHFKNVGTGREWVFVTTTCLDFVRAFDKPAIRDLMAASLIEDLRHYGATLHAFVIMPHHIHFLAEVPAGRTIAWLMNRVKSNSARRVLPLLSPETLAQFDHQRGLNGRSFWQRSFRSFVIDTKFGLWQKIGYIHENPVRAGLASSPVEYRWSSALLFEMGLWREVGGLCVLSSEFGEVPRWDGQHS